MTVKVQYPINSTKGAQLAQAVDQIISAMQSLKALRDQAYTVSYGTPQDMTQVEAMFTGAVTGVTPGYGQSLWTALDGLNTTLQGAEGQIYPLARF